VDHYIGLDAHSKTCTFVRMDKDGNVQDQGTFATNERNLIGLSKALVGKKALVLEETNVAHWMYCLMKDHYDKLIVCHAAYLPKKSGPKTDFRDALHLAHQLRTNNVTPVFHEDSFLMDLRALVTGYEDVTCRATVLIFKLKAMLRSEGIPTQSAHLTVANWQKWKELKNPAKLFVAEAMYLELVEAKERKKAYLAQFEKNASKNKTIRNLCTVPGIGPTRANVIAALIASPHRFTNKHKLWAYSKLIRHTDVSDGHVLWRRTPHGRTELKVAFMSAAHQNIFRGKSALKDYYEHLIDRGLDPKKARKALARKIAAICLTIMKKETKYDDDLVRKTFED